MDERELVLVAKPYEDLGLPGMVAVVLRQKAFAARAAVSF